MQRSAIITALLAMAAHVAYYGFISFADRAWFFYVMTGLLLAWIGWRDRRAALDALAAGKAAGLSLFAATYILIEYSQTAVCGALAWGIGTTPDRDLCVLVFGDGRYAAAASLLIAALWTWRGALWPSRPQ